MTFSVCSTLPSTWATMLALRGLIISSNRLKGSLPDAWGSDGSFRSLNATNLVLRLGFSGHAVLHV